MDQLNSDHFVSCITILFMLFCLTETSSSCPCDLTDKICDKDCCCDEACTATDLHTFSNCDDVILPSKFHSCYTTRVTYDNGSREEMPEFNLGLFCVLINNYKEATQYYIPNVEVQMENLDQDGTYSFKRAERVGPGLKIGTFYKTGDPVLTLADDGRTVGFLRMPASAMMTTCVDGTHAVYLRNQETRCSRRLETFPADCSTNPMIRASSYYKGFSIIQSPGVLKEEYGEQFSMTSNKEKLPHSLSHNSLVEVQPVAVHECIDANGDSSDCAWSSDMDTPSAQAAVCQHVVVKVDYLLNFDGTHGIKKASVRFTFKNNMAAPPTEAHVQQAFKTRFMKIGEPMVFEDGVSPTRFSGHPGYITGLHLRVGLLDKSNGVISMENYRQGLTIMTPVHDDVGVCKVSMVRTPVLFGYHYRTACVVNINIDDAAMCQSMEQTVWTALVGQEPATHIASYGNLDTKKVEEWIKIEDSPRMPEIKVADKPTCSRIISGMHLKILHVPTGSSDNPQQRIVAVKYNTEFIDIAQYKGHTTTSKDKTVRFEVTASVTFVDLTNQIPV